VEALAAYNATITIRPYAIVSQHVPTFLSQFRLQRAYGILKYHISCHFW